MHRSWLQATVLGTALVLSGYGNPATVKTQTQPVESAALERLKDTEILFWTPEQQRLGYPNIEKLITTGVIRRGKSASLLPASPRDFSKFTYAYNGKTRTIEDFFYQTNAVGLLVLKDGRVVLERYAGGNTAQTKWISFSIAKSVTSLLYGAAIRDRHIKTLDDQVIKYVPELAGTAYDGVTLRHLLQMSSGVAWNDDPRNRESDVAKLTQIDREGGLKALLAYMGRLPRAAAPGTRFNYNTAETDLAGAVLRSATGRSLSEYLSEKIWKPFGMQSDAHWVKMRSGDLERGGCCISATLRDYGRIGLFALSNGTTRNGTRILPAHWMEESTRPASTNPGYGYYWWLRRNGGYHASGIFGQHIEVNPKERVVVALQSYWTVAFNDELTGHHDAFIEAVTAAVRDARPGR